VSRNANTNANRRNPSDAVTAAAGASPGSDAEELSAEFPFESRFLEVLGSKIHYVEEGQGDPILFIHGNPTSSYLWRNIIPHVSEQGRAIALDLIGMGKSDKPDIPYRYDDHYRYLCAFIDALDLGDNITLVTHDWGSALGFRWAHEHSDRIKGIAFLDALTGPMRWSEFPTDFRVVMRLLRNPVMSYLMASVGNLFVRKMLPEATFRKITPAAMAQYKRPYPTIASRKPLAQWPKEIPVNGTPCDNHEKLAAYHGWLEQTELPKLMLYTDDSALLTGQALKWCFNLKNITPVNLGDGIHFVQETCPHRVGSELSKWYGAL
jgi:haloalkane dehalogenase